MVQGRRKIHQQMLGGFIQDPPKKSKKYCKPQGKKRLVLFVSHPDIMDLALLRVGEPFFLSDPHGQRAELNMDSLET